MDGLTCVVEQTVDFGSQRGQDICVEQSVETGKQERPDYDGNENLYAAVNIALRLLAGDSCADGGRCVANLILNFLKHRLLPQSFFFYWLWMDGLACVVEQTVDLSGQSRDDVRVEQSVETGEQERPDYDGNENLHAAVNIAFSLLICDGCADGGSCGTNLILDFLKHR